MAKEPARKVTERCVRMYERRRAALITKHGGKCKWCGSTKRLVFHHDPGKDWCPRSMSRWTRIKHYEQDDVVLLCRKCHEAHHGRVVR